MHPRVTGLVIVLAAAAIGCGGVGNDSAAPGAESEPVPRATAGASAETKSERVIRYGSLELSVPSDWPVYDLAVDPSTCVRFDVNAVYLGSPSPEMRCPAQAIGRADAVLIEAADASAAGAGSEPQVNANGFSIEVDSSRALEHELVVTAPVAGVRVTVSYGETDAAASRIVQSMRAAT